MRLYLYLIAGVTSALLGWNLGQFFLTDLGILSNFPEIVLFPCVAIALAAGMVLNEIFISSPTRPKLCLRKARIPILIALGLGLVAGLTGGLISQLVLLPFLSVPSWLVRTISWLLIGISVGLAEGLTWRFKTIEAGDKKRFQQRFRASIIGGSIASLAAAGLFELIRSSGQNLPAVFRTLEDPLGFSLLGLLLGFTFSITGSPSYLVALRAGAGFEYLGENYADPYAYAYTTSSVEPIENLLPSSDEEQAIQDAIKLLNRNNIKTEIPKSLTSDGDTDSSTSFEDISQTSQLSKPLKRAKRKPFPAIDKTLLKFVSSSNEELIEEGLSIQLPAQGKLRIGSAPDSHIYIPDIPAYVADLVLDKREARLEPTIHFQTIAVNGDRLAQKRSISLKHNYLLTFYSVNEEGINEDKFYRFVYYNRFLDPQA